MSNAVLSVTCAVDAHQQPGHFSVPMAALDALGLGHDDTVHLHVSCAAGAFDVTVPMRSGTEIYANLNEDSAAKLALIQPKERIFISVARP